MASNINDPSKLARSTPFSVPVMLILHPSSWAPISPARRAQTRLSLSARNEITYLPYREEMGYRSYNPTLKAGGLDESFARSGVPTPGGVRGRTIIEHRTRALSEARGYASIRCEAGWLVGDRTRKFNCEL